VPTRIFSQKEGMNVLSLFDGISCARVALERAGVPVKSYRACEIDRTAIKISQTHYPDIVHLGDVRNVWMSHVGGPIDLLIGGSPCQDLSIAKKGRQGLEGNRSSLFWEYVRLWNLLRPKWFVLENVASMPKADRDIITKTLGVDPIMINASLVSAQCRKRLFWTNLPVTQPEDRGICVRDILQPDAEVGHIGTTDGQANRVYAMGRDIGRRLTANGTRADADTSLPYERRIELRQDGKCGTLTSVQKDNLVVDTQTNRIRKLTPVECERLQGLPDGYTEGVAKTNRYKALGNAFNVDVVAHLLRSLRSSEERAEAS